MIILLSSFISFSIFIYLNREIFIAIYEITSLKIFSGQLSFPIRFWSIKHNLILFTKYPIIGIGVGSSGALSGFITTLTSIGLFGFFLLIWLFRESKPYKHKGVFFALVSIFIINVGAGDISTFFSPLIALFFAFISKININKSFDFVSNLK